MAEACAPSKALVWLREIRPAFFTASVAPVLVGSALAYATAGRFDATYFALALAGMLFFHAAANVGNDYFDHVSRNDWVNENPTPFSGGSRVIQEGLLTPREVLAGALIFLAGAAAVAAVLVVMTRSIFLLMLGAFGLLCAWSYTATPFRIGYRGVGEIVVGLCFGPLPVYGTYYLHTGRIDAQPLVPGLAVGALIFLVLLANEFPDEAADRKVNKRTLVVIFGASAAAWIYRLVLMGAYAAVLVRAILNPPRALPGEWLFILTAPMAVIALRLLHKQVTLKGGGHALNAATVATHFVGGVMLAAGYLVSGLRG